MTTHEFEVSEAEAGRRLDVVLVQRVPGMSRSSARALTAAGQVRVNGRRARKGHPVRAGDRVTLEEMPPERDFLAAADGELPLQLLYEDEELVVVDKPAGIPSHPLRPDERGTLAGALLNRYPEMATVGYSRREPGLVHRLDNDTSGVLLAARTARAFEALKVALRAGRIGKRYLALCAGRVTAPKTIVLPVATDPADPRRVLVCPDDHRARRLRARPAETLVVSARPVGDLCLVEVSAALARRHQIRAHLAAVGHPLAGDELYGGPVVPGLSRHFLHASRIELDHPITGEQLAVESPLPPDLQEALARAERSS